MVSALATVSDDHSLVPSAATTTVFVVTHPTLRIHNRPINTPFGLLGADENALSYALGFTLLQCPELLHPILKALGVPQWRSSWGRNMSIDGQRHREQGITDLEVHVPGRLLLVIEAKVGMSLPTIAQCQRYLNRFEERREPRQMLVISTVSDPASAVAKYRKQDSRLADRLYGMRWTDLLPMCGRLQRELAETSEARRWIVAFRQFLDQEYQMKCHTDEVWIVSANRKPRWRGGLSFYDTHVNVKRRIYYRRGFEMKRPLYIALRCNGAVRHIQRVEGIDFEARPIDYIPELTNVPEDWPSKAHTVWRLGPPVELTKPIPTGDPTMRARRCACDLDMLLTAKSVRDIERRMKERRNGGAVEPKA